MTAREAVNHLRREDLAERSGKGAHVIFKKGGRLVVVSNHAGDIPTEHCAPSVRRPAGNTRRNAEQEKHNGNEVLSSNSGSPTRRE
jgi:predicted RNA binding protein YcfA (HicA-like mRNA interferase family)